MGRLRAASGPLVRTLLLVLLGGTLLIAQPRTCKGQIPAAVQRNISTGAYIDRNKDSGTVPGLRLVNRDTKPQSSGSAVGLSLEGVFNFGVLEEPNGTEAPPLEVNNMFNASISNSAADTVLSFLAAHRQNSTLVNSTSPPANETTFAASGSSAADQETFEAGSESNTPRKLGKVSMV